MSPGCLAMGVVTRVVRVCVSVITVRRFLFPPAFTRLITRSGVNLIRRNYVYYARGYV
jgi:hypothetical protein